MDNDSFLQESNKENPIKRLIALLREHNLSAINLFWRQYLPLEVENLYDEMLEATSIDDITFTRELEKYVQIDLSRISRSSYWDIEIIRKKYFVQETYPDLSFDKYGLVKLENIKHLNKNGFFFNNKHNLIFQRLFQEISILHNELWNFKMKMLNYPF